MAWVIDHIEAGIALLESTEAEEIDYCPVKNLPKGVREGDVLVKTDEGFVVDYEERKRREIRIKEKFERLRKPRE
jgi:hypothetical protein